MEDLQTTSNEKNQEQPDFLKQLEDAFKQMKDKIIPKGFILMPGIDEYKVFEVDADELEIALTFLNVRKNLKERQQKQRGFKVGGTFSDDQYLHPNNEFIINKKS